LQKPILAAKSGCFSLCTTAILYWRNLINFVVVKADPSETPVSCAKRLNDFRGLTCSREYPEPFLHLAHFSSIASSCHKLNPWPVTFSQAYIHMTLWELVRLDIYDEIFEHTFCKFFSLCVSFDNEHTLFNSELYFNRNVHCLQHF
jgi:hypothetical protein